jgi:hypothetical protein
MARLGRYFLAEQPLHLIQRGNNREAVFYIATKITSATVSGLPLPPPTTVAPSMPMC